MRLTPSGLSCKTICRPGPRFTAPTGGAGLICLAWARGRGSQVRRPAGACHPSTSERDDSDHRRDARHHRRRGHPRRYPCGRRAGFHRRVTWRAGVPGHGGGLCPAAGLAGRVRARGPGGDRGPRQLRPRPGSTVGYATRIALRELGRRAEFLDGQIERLDNLIGPLVTAQAPSLLARYGIGAHTAALLLVAAGDHPERLRSEAAWAHLCGVTPIPASSGKTVRHRLNPGGDRQANHALWRIVFTRMGSDPATRAYVDRRTQEGLSKKEIIRCLKRYVAREVYPHLRSSG